VDGQYLVPLNQASGHPHTQRLGANSDLWFCKSGNTAQVIPMIAVMVTSATAATTPSTSGR
jgi:hypothetical protein